jgi:D-glycero-D-manno-heptose 1,7-bisphosphate phosphatase
MLRQAVVLVGGRGTRLGALTADLPKPMLAIGDRPFLELLIDEISRHGIEEVLLLCGYRAAALLDRFEGATSRGCRVSCRIEDEPAGTAGALRAAFAALATEFLLLNGDSFFDINLLNLPAVARERRWLGAVALRSLANTGRFGRVTLDGEMVGSFAEKSESGPGLINAGVYFLRREAIERVTALPSSLEREVLPQLAAEGRLAGRVYDGYFIDIGIPEELARARRELPGRRRPALFLDRDGVLNVDAGYVHRTDDLRWVPGAIETVKRFNDLGWFVVVVTNQSVIARGYCDEIAVHALHAFMQRELQANGAHVDAFFLCPHHPDGIVPEFAITCACRKPEPGMLLAAAREWPIDLERSILIGDKQSDVIAALRAGVRGLLFQGPSLAEFVAEHVPMLA